MSKQIALLSRPFVSCLIFLCYSLLPTSTRAQTKTVWQVGEADNSSSGMALAPSSYDQFLAHDFGWEDRFYIIGFSSPAKDWPYILPGPKDSWGGTAPTAGLRSHQVNVLFELEENIIGNDWKLVIDLVGYNQKLPPLFKVAINDHPWTFQLPAGSDSTAITGTGVSKEHRIEIPFKKTLLHKGGNHILLTSLDGSWLVFDQVRLEGPAQARIKNPGAVFIRDIKAASYEITKDNTRFQPLLLDIEQLRGQPKISVRLDGKDIFSETADSGRFQFEAPMPAVSKSVNSRYEILSDGRSIANGTIARSAQRLNTPADYVDTRIGTAHSRWMIAPGPWMPFSMVKLSPDNQDEGWQAGYDPTFESVGSFSHIHEWTMAGLGMLPVNGPLRIKVGGERSAPGEGYRSRIDKASEEAALGYYKVQLTDYDIKAELTATTRASFQRYTYPRKTDARIMIDLKIPAEYGYHLKSVQLKKVNDHRIEGTSHQFSPDTWSGGVNQEYTLHFVVEFDQPIKKMGVWKNDDISTTNELNTGEVNDAGAYVEFDTRVNPSVQVRTGLSYVSLEGAAKNLQSEITTPCGWSFEKVRHANLATWNKLFERVQVSTSDRREKIRFYTNMYRALCSRNTYSDVDGQWVDATEKIRQLKKPDDVALGCDAFWNTFWNLNQFWNLVTPEWSSRWVRSQLSMYDANGWLAKGPAGMEYVPVMVAEHEVPLLAGAYQMGIRDYDVQKSFEACYKTLTTPAQRVGDGLAGDEDLPAYLQYKFVPYDKGRFSNTLEYAYDDWTVAQFAQSLGKQKQMQEFQQRSTWWKNVIDTATGYARLRKSDGSWFPNFDPFKSGANEHYVEGNAWQLTFFVPQDVPGLAKAIGIDRFRERLEWGFKESEKWRFNAPNDAYWDYPVIQGNQQSMHFAFLFNWVQQPWLTQQWSRSIIDRYYGFGIANAYLGDEDQGQMSAWFIMAALGLFQTDGGCRIDPIYEIASPIFSKVKIDLGQQYGRGKSFEIEAPNVSRENKYVQSARLNGKKLDACWFPASELLKGGKLTLVMGPAPNMQWGLSKPMEAAK